MKILAYNICLSNPAKVNLLLEQNADVYVVPEIAEEERDKLSAEYAMEWYGINYDKSYMGTKSKGLGIIWRKEHGKIPTWYKADLQELKYAIPLEYNDKLIIAFWPTQDKTNGTYTKIAESIIERYKEHLKDKEIIITGDFNLYYNPPKKNYAADIQKINRILEEDLHLSSIYHKKNKVGFGKEKEKTYFQHNNKEKPFFLDYTYTNIPINRIEYDFVDLSEKLGKTFSDHIGQIIIL